MTVNAYNASSDRYECDDDILEAAPENPVRFLWPTNDDHVWKGMIDGIDDLDRLEAYRQAEKRHITRSYKKARVHKYLDERERELVGDDTDPGPAAIDAEPTPVTATDGGTKLSDSEDDTESADGTESEPEPEPDEIHPNADGLEAGQVLVVDRGDSTEFVWPTTPESDTPFIARMFDAEGDERTDEPIPITEDEIRPRLDYDPDRKATDAIDKTAPAAAASNGGDR